MAETCVLAYSGGLDTSVAVAWIQETYGYDVVTCTADLGNVPDLEAVQQKAIASGAKKAVIVDAREVFVTFFVWPALQAGALYQDAYPLATALGRPLIAKLLVDTARQEGAHYVAHGSTGKGNDQVRFDLAVHALAPDLGVIAPMRGGMNMSREEEIAYAKQRGIPVPVTKRRPYSVDENLWGRSIEAGVLEDAWSAPPPNVFEWTVEANAAPERAATVVIGFASGVPVSLEGKKLSGVAIVQRLNELAGAHGVGRIDVVEDRLVGIKSREIYEAPAAVTLHAAHRALEEMTLTRDAQRLKRQIAQEYARVVYDGLWFSAHHQDLSAYVRSTQRFVTGEVKVRLHRGAATVIGRKSKNALYQVALATYSKADRFDHKAAEGFIEVFGLPIRTQARTQALWSGDVAASLELERKAIAAPKRPRAPAAKAKRKR